MNTPRKKARNGIDFTECESLCDLHPGTWKEQRGRRGLSRTGRNPVRTRHNQAENSQKKKRSQQTKLMRGEKKEGGGNIRIEVSGSNGARETDSHVDELERKSSMN